MDSVYDVKNDIAIDWKLKRSSVKREMLTVRADITKNELEQVFQQFGLDAESNPMNKHYVRCMHDQGTNISQQCIPFLGVHIGVYQP